MGWRPTELGVLVRFFFVLILVLLPIRVDSVVLQVYLHTSFQTPVTGRVLVYFSTNNLSAPLDQVNDDQNTAQVFGTDVGDLKPGDYITIDESVLGYPRRSLLLIPTGEYYLQAQLKIYEKYQRGDGITVLLPSSCVDLSGHGSVPEGTLFSNVIQVQFTQESDQVLTLTLDQVVPTRPSLGCVGDGRDESDWIKSVKIRSSLLSEWWGRDITLEACVLIPWGFDSHPNARYPLVIAHGHYSVKWNSGGEFSEKEPSPDKTGYDFIQDLYAYYLYRNWTSDSGIFRGARMLVATIKHPVPFFDDSYAVNSANMGPYGNAINYELVPEIEKRFRGMGKGWARALYGGSTGGWEALAVQVAYPDDYNGAYAACPDPISFTSYTSLNIYNEPNAYFYESDWKRTPRPAQRDEYSGHTIGYGHPYGRTVSTLEEVNLKEIVLGTRGRSCGQWDIWEAVFGPQDEEGYPARLYDRITGEINETIAAYWRDNYDLLHIMKRSWSSLGQKLVKKIHLYVGASDTYFLNNAVMDAEDFLETTRNPYYDGEVVIGDHGGRGFEHCFSGYDYWPNGEKQPNSITRLTYNQRFLPIIAKHFVETAPAGADVTSWRY